MSQCEQLAKSQIQGGRLVASAKKSQENTYVECIFEGNLFDNEQAKIYTPPPPH